ncbi:guanylate kinase [Pasteurellaceae bacterium 20609_3]|uniref:guanylate kinase n=1 Tax=Spirabiliibacterium mucosae TaxID=28156 RepID=UPI001AAD3607|nr:guanylate kinase [Spirabiliibacterium mucosae]MBE2899160.1 guanylate kinase [Spirabiliibacterium mucosae]
MQYGQLYIISAPSGAGKSSLIAALLNNLGEGKAKVSVSHTTRAPRPGEVDGVHYYFCDVGSFKQHIADGHFLEYAQVFENYYGTSKPMIEESLAQGIDVFLDIDWQGAQQVREKLPECKSIFILPPSLAELEQRLQRRGQDSEEVIAKRMEKAIAEMSHYAEYDYVVVNDQFQQALCQLQAILQAEKLTLAAQQKNHGALIAQLLAKS